MEKSFYKMMDYFFDMLLILSGEEAEDEVSIGHIL